MEHLLVFKVVVVIPPKLFWVTFQPFFYLKIALFFTAIFYYLYFFVFFPKTPFISLQEPIFSNDPKIPKYHCRCCL